MVRASLNLSARASKNAVYYCEHYTYQCDLCKILGIRITTVINMRLNFNFYKDLTVIHSLEAFVYKHWRVLLRVVELKEKSVDGIIAVKVKLSFLYLYLQRITFTIASHRREF